MGETVIEKIIRNNVGKTVKPGDIVTVNVDRVMIHDIFIPFVAEKFEEMGFTKLWDPDKVVLIYDHLVPASQLDDTRHFHAGDAFAKKYGMKNVHRSDGICHQLMTEAGYAKPGNIVFGTDSHTTTYGCVGCFSSGIGYTEMASILGTGEMWVRVPETIKVVIDGKLPENVTNTKNLKAEIEVEVTKKEVTPPVETKDVISVEKPEKVTVEEGTTFEDLKKDHSVVITLEDGILDGGFGEKIARFYGDSNMKVLNFGLKKEFLDRYNVTEVLKDNHLTKEQIVEDVARILA